MVVFTILCSLFLSQFRTVLDCCSGFFLDTTDAVGYVRWPNLSPSNPHFLGLDLFHIYSPHFYPIAAIQGVP
ncbi:hypothetical protein Y032_0896g2922 [Ancylostoma ceylanicum]|uniref:Secreted protein n=1 Tax=Ancylostoma ceylanicum TaxID=53326 RepID=A0A016WBQ1_9BILA|nr:hypothetical protein Y032_0896g2922 [Ancylostoma ceylanicum]